MLIFILIIPINILICIAMQLADIGFDVWLANCRGNSYSRKHVSIKSENKTFWNFRYNYNLLFMICTYFCFIKICIDN